MRTRVVIALLGVLALVASACGDDASSGSTDAPVGDEVVAEPVEAASDDDEVAADDDEVAAEPVEAASDDDEVAADDEAADDDEVAAEPVEAASDDDEVAAEDEAATDGLPSGQTIAFSHPAAQAGVVAKVVEFAHERAAETGTKLIVGAFENGTPDEQFTQVENWITQGVDAIHVFPLDPNSLVPLQERAQANGITWVTYLLEMPGADGILTVPPRWSGEALAAAAEDFFAANDFEGTAMVLQFSFIPTAAERIDIPAAAVEAAGFEIVSREDIIDTAGALTATENVLTANPDLRVVVAITDDAAVGAARAMENAGIDPSACFVGGVDGTQEALEMLRSDDTCYKASATVDVRLFGRNVIDVTLRAIAGEDAVELMEPMIVTATDTELLNDLLSAYE